VAYEIMEADDSLDITLLRVKVEEHDIISSYTDNRRLSQRLTIRKIRKLLI